MKTLVNPGPKINEFTYEGCRYSGIAVGQKFSVLSDGLAAFLIENYPFIQETEVAQVAANEYCCSKCGKDCGSKYMKARHEKVCKAENSTMAPILKPVYIFWNYKNLDKTQLTPDQLFPQESNPQPQPQLTEMEVSQPAPGRPGMAMIGKNMEPVVTDREGVDWYGPGLEDDLAH